MLLAEAGSELSHLRSCVAKLMKKAEECQEVQRREILGIFVLKPRRKPQDANKQAGTEIQQWLQM